MNNSGRLYFKKNKALLVVFIFLCFSTYTNALSVPISQLLKGKSLNTKVSLQSNDDGFMVIIEAQNLSKDLQQFYLEPGRTINAIDDKYQDLVITSSVEMQVKPKSISRSVFRAYCKNKHKIGPPMKCKMELGSMATESLVRMCRYLADQNFEAYQINQNAVWAISDTVPFERYDSSAATAELRRYIDISLGKVKSTYTLEYDSLHHEQEPTFFEFEDHYALSKQGMVNIVFTDFNGNVIRELLPATKRSADRFALQLRIMLKDIRRGVYYVKVMSDGKLQKQWEVYI